MMLADCKSATPALIAEQTQAVAPNQYATIFHTLLINDSQQQATTLISSCILRYHHSVSESEVWLNTVDSIKVLTINLDTENDVVPLIVV